MRWILRIVFGLLALVVLAVAVLFLLPADRIAKLVTDRFETATGRSMTLAGDVRPTLWPELGVNTGPVTISNAQWSDAGPMLSAERLSIGVDIMALISGDIRIKRVEIESPAILLEKNADGQGNWEMATGAATGPVDGADQAGGIPAFTLDRATITGGLVAYSDRGTGSEILLTGIEGTLGLPDFDGPASIEMSAVMNGQEFSVAGSIAEFSVFLADGAVPVTARVDIGGSSVDFGGRAGLSPLAAGGTLDAKLTDMSAVFGLIGMQAPQIPAGFGRQIAVSGEMTATGEGRVTLRGGTIGLDQNILTGALDISMSGERPRVTGNLSAGALDFSALAADDGSGGNSGGTGEWSRDVIDVSALQTVDAEIALDATSVDLGLATLGRVRTLTTLDNGRAVTEVREVRAYDGLLTGTFVLNSRGGLSTRANLKGDAIALRPLLQELAGYERLLAISDVSINLLGVGNSMYALMNSLEGEGSLRLGQGELRGLDLVGMLRNLDPNFVGEGAKTIFESISLSFQVKGGVLTNSDLIMTSPLLRATGSGNIGIGGQTLDYRIVPTILEGQTEGGIKVPVLVTGSWANPKFKLDLESLAREKLDIEAEKLKVKAEDEVRARVEKELGVTLDKEAELDDAVKDAVKTEIEDRARSELLKLLGGQ